MNSSSFNPHPDANSSSFAYLDRLPPGTDPFVTPDPALPPAPAPQSPRLANKPGADHSPLDSPQDEMDVDTGEEPSSAAQDTPQDNAAGRGLKRGRPDTDENQVLEHSEPVCKLRRSEVTEPAKSEPATPSDSPSRENLRDALKAAIAEGDLDKLQALVSQTDPEIINNLDHILWYATVRYGQLAILVWLYEQPDRFNQSVSKGSSLFLHAAEHGHLPIVQWMAEQGSNIHETDHCGNNALMLAAAEGHLSTVQWLAKQGCDMHRENNDGDNTFTLAIESKPLELLRTLTEQGRNIHLPDDSKDDASILATKGDQLDLVRWLAEQGCYIHQINYDGDNAVSLAARSGNLDLVRWLVEQGCYIHQINNAGDNAITVAVWSGKLDLVQWLASQGCNIHKVNHYGNNALSHAVRLGDLHLDLIQWLVDQECNIYQVNRNGETPLIIATENNCLETVKCLLEKSRSLCQIDPSVFAALKIAINNNKPLIAECLIKSGADFTLFRTKDGDGLLAWALKNRHLDIIQYLLPLHHPALRSASGDTVLMTAAKLGLVEFALPLIRTALQHREGPSLLGEAQLVATDPLFKECLAQPGFLLLPELAPSMSTMRAHGFADIATRVVLDHYFSLCNALSSLSPLLGAPQDMSALQNMAAEAGILAGLAAWKQLNYSDNIFLPDAINNPPGLADRFNQFISKDIDQLVAQALQWEEDNLAPVVGDLYEICLRHVIAGNRASDIASELARKGLYQPIASRIASAWHTTWESASNEAAPLLQPMITSSFDDWEHEDLAAMDPITGLPVVTPEAVASMIEHFVETAAGAGLLQRFRSALQRELDSTGQGLLRAQAPNLSQSSKDLYADLIMRQLHMVAQFWRQG